MADLVNTWPLYNLLDAGNDTYDLGLDVGRRQVQQFVDELHTAALGQQRDDQFANGIADAAGDLRSEFGDLLPRDPLEPSHVAVDTQFDQAPVVELHNWIVQQGVRPGVVEAARAVKVKTVDYRSEEQDDEDAEYDDALAEWQEDEDADPDDKPEPPDRSFLDGCIFTLAQIQEHFGITDDEMEEK